MQNTSLQGYITSGKFKLYTCPESVLIKNEGYDKYLQIDLLNNNHISEVTGDSISGLTVLEVKVHPMLFLE